MNQGVVREVMDIIANGYGSVPTGLDRSIATRVVEYFNRIGWMSPTDVAILVEAAGGEIRVPENILTGTQPMLYSQLDPSTNEYVFRTRERVEFVDVDELTENAKVNPDAEMRVVDSGPIDITIERR
jgi:hypothetical protein